MIPRGESSITPNESNGQIYRTEHNILNANRGYTNTDNANDISNNQADWRPTRRRPSDPQLGGRHHISESPTRKSVVNQIPESIDSINQLQKHTVNAEVITILRSQITELLEENERILNAMEEYREQVAVLNREKAENERNPSSELVALQSELADARMREAELTVAFGELHHRIAAIDRIIESDPDMEQFFNAVSISTTTLSCRPTDSTGVANHRNTSPVNRISMPPRERSLDPAIDRRSVYQPSPHDRRSPRRSTIASTSMITSQTRQALLHNKKMATKVNPLIRSKAFSTNHNMEAEQHNNVGSDTCRSGLESPQSDSGCSSTSQNTASDPLDSGFKNGQLKIGGKVRRLTADDNNFSDEAFSPDEESLRTRGLASLLRRSRSSATDKSLFMNAIGNGEFSQSSPRDLEYHADQPDYHQIYRPSDDTPTPTEECQKEPAHRNPSDTVGRAPVSPSAPVGDNKRTDRLSRLRASFRESFGFGPAKPDFRNEAFAARQGEARALLALRETRLELLRLQARSQTLQRHIERLESVNESRVEDLENSKVCERDLRQEIRTLQRQIFNSEAEHREYVVNQRITEMELMSKLAEANLLLSHAELANQQAEVWSELNKAHEAATSLLNSSGQSASARTDVYQKTGPTDRPGEASRCTNLPRNQQVGEEQYVTSTDCTNLQKSGHRADAALASSGMGPVQNDARCSRSSNDSTGSGSSTSMNAVADAGLEAPRSSTHYHFQRRDMEQSLGSMSDLRLQPDFPVMTRNCQGW